MESRKKAIEIIFNPKGPSIGKDLFPCLDKIFSFPIPNILGIFGPEK